jgi:uncharacterized membrane protein
MLAGGRNMDEQKPTIKRIGGYLHKVIPIKDAAGNVLNFALKPFMVEFRPRDLLQIIVGATILAIPLAFTEETWVLGVQMPMTNVLLLALVSILFLSFFVYFNYYRFNFTGHKIEYLKRVSATYLCSLIVVGLILTIIQKCPWGTNNIVALKRIVIVAFPASMSATISDIIK